MYDTKSSQNPDQGKFLVQVSFFHLLACWKGVFPESIILCRLMESPETGWLNQCCFLNKIKLALKIRLSFWISLRGEGTSTLDAGVG